MFLKFTIGLALLPVTMMPASADNARCFLEYQSNIYVDGPCEFIGAGGGSFRINADGWAVDLGIVDEGWAQAWWNADGHGLYGERVVGAARLHSNMGYLRRDEDDSACWSNHEAKVCAW
tara:strand:+ start:396 stop:752 length:357 start_codon:yes stop_codon:yes gene_type:complete